MFVESIELVWLAVIGEKVCAWTLSIRGSCVCFMCRSLVYREMKSLYTKLRLLVKKEGLGDDELREKNYAAAVQAFDEAVAMADPTVVVHLVKLLLKQCVARKEVFLLLLKSSKARFSGS